MPTDYIQNIDGAERRMVSEGLEMRAEGDQQYFEGYAFVYGAIADLGDFTEEIQRGAADSVLTDDVRGLFNHDPNIVLGRSTSKTMSLSADDKGLKYTIRYNPNDPDHVKIMEKVKRGDISQSSFAFRTDTDKWETRNGKDHRTITKFKRLIDVSPVTYPAYNEATVAHRSLDKIKNDYKKDLAEMGVALMKQELNAKQK